MQASPSRKALLLIFFIGLKFFLQYIILNPAYELHRDEYLHLDQGAHLAWGFISVPPFTSWVSWLIALLGNSIFWVKFFPALFGALTLLAVWKTVEALGGGLYALLLSATCICFSSLLRFNMLYQPNSFDILSWTLLYACLVHYFITKKNKWIWFAALTFALGFLNKYNIIFCVAGLLPALLLERQRSVFANRTLYYAFACALLLISPNIAWQIAHDFPVAKHMKELADTQLVNVNRADFLKEQVLFFLGALLVIIGGVIGMLTVASLRKFRFLLWALIITLAIFTYLKAKNYYAVGLYPIFIAFGAFYWEKILRRNWRLYLRPVLLIMPLLLFIPFWNIAFPVKSPEAIAANPGKMEEFGLLRWEDGKNHPLPQDFADMIGWKQLAAITDSAYAQIQDKQHTLVRCDNYGQAGAINYYSSFPQLQAVSYNADYVNWFPQGPYTNLILVKTNGGKPGDWTRELSLFDTGYVAGSITNSYARELHTTVYVLKGAHPQVQQIIRKEIKEAGGE